MRDANILSALFDDRLPPVTDFSFAIRNKTADMRFEESLSTDQFLLSRIQSTGLNALAYSRGATKTETQTNASAEIGAVTMQLPRRSISYPDST